ncbi:MAG: hypothetical protein HY869_01840 [Chloroflexi bacterium]|nr:hypothetical protein [Chloroflexota bacterium]
MKKQNHTQLSKYGILIGLLILVGGVMYGMQSGFWATIMSAQSRETSSSVRDGLLHNLPCTVPCWQGITPGVTTKDEAITILQNSTFIPADTLQSGEKSESRGGAHWKWRTEDSFWTESRVEWCDEIVCEIALHADSAITVDEVMARFGVPDKVSIIDIGIPENPEWGFSFYYPRHGLEVLVHVSGGLDAVLEPSENIFGVYLFPPMTIEERIVFSGLSIETQDLRDWNGYGNIIDKYVK